MASKKKKAAGAATGAYGAAKAAKDNQYVQRLAQDDELRETIVEAYESIRSAVDRLGSGKASPAKQVFDDKKLQKDIREAAYNVRDASVSLRDGKPKKSGGGLFRKLLLLVAAGGIALAVSEDLRKKALDALFGSEEEFEYTSTTTPPAGGATGGATEGASTSSSTASAS